MKLANLPAASAVAFVHRLGFVDGDRTAVIVCTVDFLYGFLSLGIGCHLDETESLTTALIAIGDERGGFNSADGGEFIDQVLFADGVRQITDI